MTAPNIAAAPPCVALLALASPKDLEVALSDLNPNLPQGGDSLSRLIPITQRAIGEAQASAISGRDLHAFLEVEKDFSDWMKAQIARARLVQHRDYEVFAAPPERGAGNRGSRVEYALTMDAAKHIAMMAGTDKGFQVREYFIECERRANDPVHTLMHLNRTDTIRLLLATCEERDGVQAQVVEMRPKAALHDAIVDATGHHSIAEAAKLLGTGQKRLFALLREKDVLNARNVPYQEFQDRGYLEIKEKPIHMGHLGDVLNSQTFVTGKGLAWIQRKFFGTEAGS